MASFLYKILVSQPPLPLLSSASLVTPLDVTSGFIHLSTSSQVPDTLIRFFTIVDAVFLVKIPYSGEALTASIKWELAQDFPHLYGEVQVPEGHEWQCHELHRNGDWLASLKDDSWLEY